MKKCPRCSKQTLHEETVLNSLSRRDKKTYICNKCGQKEAFIDYGMIPPDQTERDFVAAIKEERS